MTSSIRMFLAGSTASLLLAAATSAQGIDTARILPQVQKEVTADYPRLEAIYRELHQHPELSLQEVKTAARLAAEMRGLGFEVTEGVGGTGLVAVYRNGEGPVVLVRTEMDALPMEEKTGLPYASRERAIRPDVGTETFVAHSCGHDIHMASWLGTAKALLSMKGQWRGTLVFVGQPAEESGGGARRMVEDGLLTRFPKPNYGLALHVDNGEVGKVYYKPGVFNSSASGLNITFHGKGSHGSRPHQGIDPILMAAQFIVDVQPVISRQKDPQEFGVVSIGSIHSGSAGNIIPDESVVTGTIRTQDKGVQTKILDGVRRTALAVAQMAGAPEPDIQLRAGGDPIYNDPGLATRIGAVFQSAFGNGATQDERPITASEDFQAFGAAGNFPYLYFRLGGTPSGVLAEAKAKGEEVPTNHSPFFAPDPTVSIPTGVTAMTLAVLELMQHGS